MPYTKEELGTIGYYTDYIDTLRSKYISKLVDHAKKLFRSDEGVLYSFENITRDEELGIGLGIEDAVVINNPDYSTLETELNRTILEPIGYLDFQTLFEKESSSVQRDKPFVPKKDQSSEQLVDRSISKLLNIDRLDSYPGDLKEGDLITTTNPTDPRKWLLDNGQKRPFLDLQSFYAYSTDWALVKERKEEVIDEIPEGDPVD